MAERSEVMTRMLLVGGTVVDATGTRRHDVVIEHDRVVAEGPGLAAQASHGDAIVDCGGCIVGPGLVDLHTHLRQPGKEEAETIESGSRAAALGGYTAVLAMPNTSPTVDCAAVVREVLELGRIAGLVDVYASGAITVGRAGERLAPMAEMAALGVRIFTDDGTGVQDTRLMRRAMEYAATFGVTLAQHCEDDAMADGGVMHEGEWSSRLGLAGQPSAAEELMVMRDLTLSRLTGARVHFQHMSCRGSVEMIRAARAAGRPVSAEATPHHFTLTHAECATFDPVFKVNPPLRTADDVAEVKRGLTDGALDCIATDHAPHAPQTKELPFDEAPPGMLGLQTALALALTELALPVEHVLALMSWRPAAIAGCADEHGAVGVGRRANLCVIDPGVSWTVDRAALASRSRNTPFHGRRVTGQVRHTVYRGQLVVHNGMAQQ
jgi:dihydroorotase